MTIKTFIQNLLDLKGKKVPPPKEDEGKSDMDSLVRLEINISFFISIIEILNSNFFQH